MRWTGELGVAGGWRWPRRLMARSGAWPRRPSPEPSPSTERPRPSSRSPWRPIRRAPRSTRRPVPNETLVLGNGNTMGNIMVWVSKGVPAGKTYPVPKTPVVIDQSGCRYKPHVIGIMAGQPYRILNSDGVLHNIHALPKVNTPFNKPMPATVKETTTKFDKPEAEFPGQVRRPPLDERLRGRVQPSLLLGDRHGREVHDLGPRPRDLRDHRLARAAGDPDRLGHGRRQRHQDARISSSPSPPQSSDSDTGERRTAA